MPHGRLKSGIRNCWEAFAGLFYPEVCQCCGEERATAKQGYVGSQCRQKIELIAPPFCSLCGLPYPGAITTEFVCSNCREMTLHFFYARSAASARDLLLDIIHRYKYYRALWLEPFLAELLIKVAGPILKSEGWDMVIPVPLHPRKLKEREFNQSEPLAHRLAKHLGLPMRADIVLRVIDTDSQARLNRQKRIENVRNAFATRKGSRLSGKRVVLVDDVMTTGATTSECAKALRKAGAEEVCVWTLARPDSLSPRLR